MRKFICSFLLLFLAYVYFNPNAGSWGFYAHKKINRMAVFTLPPEMILFYKSHIDLITSRAVVPDQRRYVSDNEAPRHYIDIDHYAPSFANPFDSVPEQWHRAVDKYSEDTLLKYGIVPWHVERVYYWLVKAFVEKNPEKILRLSADLGHYVADAHVPLHTTENYNGQLTGQEGIHAFWESRLPELKAREYDFYTGKGEYISDPLEYIWEVIRESHAAKDSVLNFEKDLNDLFGEDRKYVYEKRGQSVVRQYSREYALKYHEMLHGMVERRMRKAVHTTGSLWYSAWVSAGQPDLDKLIKNNTFKLRHLFVQPFRQKKDSENKRREHE